MSLFGDKDNVLRAKMPDLTPAQVVALVGAIIATAVSFGVDISKDQEENLLILIGLVASVLIGGDAVLRGQRAKATAEVNAAQAQATAIERSSLGPAMDYPVTAPAPDRDDTELPQRSPIVPS